VLGEGIMLPATRFRNARFAPEAGRAVEIKEASAPAACDLLEEQMTIEKHRLHACEKGIATVEVAPARLDHADLRISEKVDGRPEQLALRHKVGVENTNEITASGGQPRLKRPRLVANAIGAMNQLDVEA